MSYILTNKEDLSIRVADNISQKDFVIPTKLASVFRDLTPLEEAVYYGVLYPAKHAEDKLKYPDDERKGICRGYKLIEPEPWLIAITYIMWQGITQGIVWDSVKLIVKQALNKLASFSLAPNPSSKKVKISSKSQFGFSWVEYGTDGNKQYEMFLGLKKRYEKMTEKERLEVINSVIKKSSKGKK